MLKSLNLTAEEICSIITEMIYLITVGVLIILLLLFYIVILINKGRNDTFIVMLQQQIESLRQQMAENMTNSVQRIDQVIANVTSQVNQQLTVMTQQLQTTTGQIGDRLDSASRTIADVKEGLGVVSEASKRIFDVAKDMAELQDLLKPSKIRGVVGEVLLENLLEDILPGKFKTQYRFKDGSQVDFVIFLRDRLVPIDAKFPVESFRRLLDAKSEDERIKLRKEFIATIKKHIDKIASKYIRPDENTLNFAMMYIPAENIYYETIIRENDKEESLFTYSIEKNVTPVSPNTFLAYLMTIMLGFKGMEIERNARFVLDAISKLQIDLDMFKKEFDILGNHLKNAMNKYDESYRRFLMLSEKVTGITQTGALPPGRP